MKNLIYSASARCGWLGSILLLGALLSLLPGSSALAQDTSAHWAGVNKIDEFRYKVWGCNPASLRGTVRLVNAKGDVLHVMSSTDISFGQRLNVSELPDGEYKFLVTIGKEVHSFALNLQTLPARSLQPERLAQVSPELMPTDRSIAKTKMFRRQAERAKAVRADKS
ncbi:hypothetical protein [Hymenobacter arizonensis]|uniref:DUF4369 domain-containing protein n=1 Tax=Hymenobacter arizonensis TaxID=1227077 RepID=A0A1I6B7A1_HYMAR|nr:hypothetical protein [Hymenobacter arizonensis]SFQ76784.1 hypothetical protein SAMN04515668_4250 [Hymenobacter arizonensis]